MNKQMILIFFWSLANILAKDQKNIKHNSENLKYFTDAINESSNLSGIEIKIDKYGIKFNTSHNPSSKNRYTMLSIHYGKNGSKNKLQIPSIRLGTNVILGDGSNPIIITSNKNPACPINWPKQSEINILAINNEGNLITTNSVNGNSLGSDGYNQILCPIFEPIIIRSHSPANGDIIFTIDTQTEGNIKFYGNNFNLVNGLALLAIDKNNNIITTDSKLAYMGNVNGNYISIDNSDNNKGIIIDTHATNENIQISVGNCGDIYFNSSKIETPENGDIYYLGINELNQITTITGNTPMPEIFSNLTVIGSAIIGSYSPGDSACLTINNNSSNNTNNGVMISGDSYFVNSGFPLPGTNQSTALVIDSNGKLGSLLS